MVSVTALVALALSACGASSNDSDDPGKLASSDTTATVYNYGTLAHPGSCLDAWSAGTADGTQLDEWECNGTGAQSYAVLDLGNGTVNILNTHANKCVDVYGAGTANGNKVDLWDCNGTVAQTFVLRPAANGFINIVNPNSNKCLDVAGDNPANGTLVQLYDCNGTNAQLWNPAAVGTVSTSSGGSPAPSPSPSPAPSPSPGGALPTRLRVTNQCTVPIWMAHSDNVPDAPSVQINPGQSHDVPIPDGGLSATRVWPKIGCDGSGNNCTIGESVAPCPSGGCQPPVDSKFEATFAPVGGAAQTWYNLSQVDGYTLPFKVVPRGDGAEQGGCVTSDCSNLSLDECPGNEDLSGEGADQSFAHEDLRLRDGQGHVIGCLSPCKKWNYPAPWGLGESESADPGLHLCCPTPIDPSSGQCTEANACMTSAACSNAADPLSVVHTQYVAALHSMCPSAYAYAYDDAAGLHNCPSDTGFEVVFCP
jgi:hypothetical protein